MSEKNYIVVEQYSVARIHLSSSSLKKNLDKCIDAEILLSNLISMDEFGKSKIIHDHDTKPSTKQSLHTYFYFSSSQIWALAQRKKNICDWDILNLFICCFSSKKKNCCSIFPRCWMKISLKTEGQWQSLWS